MSQQLYFLKKQSEIFKVNGLKEFTFLLICLTPFFLITGPFLADLNVTLISITFLYIIFKNKEFKIFLRKDFLFFIFFFLICIISSLNSEFLLASLKTSIPYIRFGLLFLAISFFLKESEKIISSLFFFLCIIYFCLTVDATFQKVMGFNLFGLTPPYGRITSFFGSDIKLGGYIARILPLFFALSIHLKVKKIYSFLIMIVSIYLCALSGERTSLLLALIFIYGYALVSNLSSKYKAVLLISPFLFVAIILNSNKVSHYRYISQLNSQLNFEKYQPFFYEISEDGRSVLYQRDSTTFPRVYHMFYETSVKIFKDHKLLGSGPRTYRFLSEIEPYNTISNHAGFELSKKINNDSLVNLSSSQIKWLKDSFNKYRMDTYPGYTGITSANSHPHNFYLQVLTEVGIFGFILILFLFLYLIYFLLIEKSEYRKCIILGLVANLFPFMFTGNFFNNWLSIVMFFPVGFLIRREDKN